MAQVSGRFKYALVAATVCTLTACGDSTGPDLSAGQYLFRTVAAGGNHTCGIRADSTLLCWGGNDSRQLGDGTTQDRWTPTPVEGGHRFTAVSAGWRHTCGLTADGWAYCWGSSDGGGLGDGTTDYSRESPTAVAGGLHFTAITAGGGRTCGITTEGSAYCWGGNHYGGLGDGTQEDRTAPTPVAGHIRFASLSAGGSHTCGVALDGTVHCWGRNYAGQLGVATTEACGSASQPCSTVPLEVSGSIAFDQVTAGGGHTCAIVRDGTAYCWGSNYSGQLGTATTETCGSSSSPCSPIPVQVSSSIAFDRIAAGTDHTCAVAREGTTYCWGDNYHGKLGEGTTEDSPLPSPVASSARFATVGTGYGHTCGVSREGVLYCWGSNSHGQLGDGSGSLGWSTPVVVWGW